MYKATYALFLLVMIACSTPQGSVDETNTAVAAAPAAPAASYAGEWEVTVRDTPAGTVTGSLMLEEGTGELSGKFLSNGRETTLRSVEETEEGLRIEFYSTEYQTDVYMDLRGEAGSDELTGTALGSYGVVATRKK